MSSSALVHIASKDQLATELAAPAPLVVLYFYADWAAPCASVTKLLENLAQEYPQVKYLRVRFRVVCRRISSGSTCCEGQVNSGSHAGRLRVCMWVCLVLGVNTRLRLKGCPKFPSRTRSPWRPPSSL